ncbi:type I Iterative Polyketide synthase (PKS), partial [Aspergillus brasiliensis]
MKEQARGTSSLEPIAIIGMGCRFAGEASCVEGFWDTLRLGRREHGRVPASRYQASAWEHPSHDRKGAINHDSGFFLAEDPSRFDAPFFSITSKEAAGMDPVQRILLEVAYEAFENGGVPMETLPGSATGVYSGCMTNDYELLSTRDIMDMPHNSATGNGRTMLANRLSWFFDLRGPSIMLDTACSSSLTALHLATQALRAGECSQRLSYMHMLSADGISHSFDSKANGYGRGEGFGAILLKPLSKAMADGDPIRAIVRATGSNQDGRTPGITMPNPTAQADLIRATYSQAQLSMGDTTYFEAHGTGTAIGDPTELSAIGASFGAERKPGDEPVYVGSVKSNLGHTEGAAGVAGIIKVVLCLEKGMLVPNAGFSNMNPKIRLEEWGLRLSNTTTPWPAHLSQRASINSFGFGGANAHAILESTTQYLGTTQAPLDTNTDEIPQVVVVSTHDQSGLDRTADKWKDYLDSYISGKGRGLGLSDIADTLATRRSQLPFRSFAVVNSVAELRDMMVAGLPSFPRASRKNQTHLAFVFTGQGAQWPRMGMQLLANPVFAASMERSQQVLQTLDCPWDLLEEIRADATTSRISQPDRSQSSCCALQVALVDLLRSWGVTPKAVVGHSSGEVGAAYAAGYLTHEDSIRVTYFRGVLSQRIAEGGSRGGMLAAGISVADAQGYLQTLPPESVVVACVNSPLSVTLSGNIDEIELLERRLQADGRFARRLRVDTAYHSPHMRALADDYKAVIECVRPVDKYNGSISMFSSVTKELLQAADLDASYWVRNLVSPVEFSAAVTKVVTMTEAGKGRGRRRVVPVKWAGFLEIGPHEALKGPFNQTLQEVNADLTSTPYRGLVLRKQDSRQTSLQVAGLLWCLGYAINLDTANQSFLDGIAPHVSRDLPSYAWNHQSSFWHEPLESARLRQRTEPRHDLLGVPWDCQIELEPRWRNFLRVSELPWLADHVVAGSIVYPAAGMVSMVAEAARQLSDATKWLEGIEFYDLDLFRGVVIPSDKRGLEIVLHVAPHHGMSGWYEFGIFSKPENSSWIQHAKGAFSPQYAGENGAGCSADWQSTVQRVRQTQFAAKMADIEAVYEWLSEIGGVSLGPTFRSMAGVAFDSESRLYVTGVAPDTKQTMPYERESPCLFHPTSLDSLFQAAVVSCSDALSNHNANIPVGVERLYLSTDFSLQPGDRFDVHVETRYENGVSLSESIASHPSWQQPGVVLQGVRLGRVPTQSGSSTEEEVQQSRFSTLHWAEHVDSSSGPEVLPTRGLQIWVDRICHTHGDARVLALTTKNSDLVLDALEGYTPKRSRRPRLQQLTIVLSDPDTDESTNQAKAIQESLDGCQVLPVASLQDIGTNLLGESVYDAIIVDHPDFWSGADAAALLDSFLSIARPDSWVAARATAETHDATVRHVLDHADWELQGAIEHSGYVLIRRQLAPVKLDPTVYILSSAAARSIDHLLHELDGFIGKLGSKIELVDIDQASELKDKTIISLFELHNPWIAKWTPDEISRFRSLLEAKCLLWVSQCPGHEASGYAGFGATTGLLRTVRHEYPHIALPQLLVSENDKDPHSLARSIAHVLQLTLQPRSRPHDWEFYVQDNRLLVPRAVAAGPLEKSMDALLHGPRPALGELAQDSRPLHLCNKSQDINDAWWELDDRLDTALTDDLVEVQLHKVSISGPTGKGGLSPEARIAAIEALGTVRHVGTSIGSTFRVGDEVLCVIPSDAWSSALATHVRLPASAVWNSPLRQDQAKSVSMPVALAAAYTSLFGSSRASVSSVLIVGSISQTLRATVDCALAAGMQVYVAVDDENGVNEMSSKYTGMKERIIPIHRDLDTTVKRLTGGKGVELSVCCLGGFVSRLAARCLAYSGRFVDLSEELNLAALPQILLD